MALVLLGATLAAGCTKNETIEPDTNQEGSLKIVATIEQPKTKSFLSGTTVVEGETEFTQDWIGNETIFIFNAAAEPTSTDTGVEYIYAKHSGMVGYSGSSTLVFDSIQKTSGFSFGSAGSQRKLFATVLFTGSSFTPSMKTYQNTMFGVWGSSDNRDGLVKPSNLQEVNPINVTHLLAPQSDGEGNAITSSFEYDYMFKANSNIVLPADQPIKAHTQLTTANGLSQEKIDFLGRNLVCEGAMQKFAVADYTSLGDGVDAGTISFNFKNMLSVIRIPFTSSTACKLKSVRISTWEGATSEGNNHHCTGSMKLMIKQDGTFMIYPYNSTAGKTYAEATFSGFGAQGTDNFVTLDTTPTYVCLNVYPRFYEARGTNGESLKLTYIYAEANGTEHTVVKYIKSNVDMVEPAVYTFASIAVE